MSWQPRTGGKKHKVLVGETRGSSARCLGCAAGDRLTSGALDGGPGSVWRHKGPGGSAELG